MVLGAKCRLKKHTEDNHIALLCVKKSLAVNASGRKNQVKAKADRQPQNHRPIISVTPKSTLSIGYWSQSIILILGSPKSIASIDFGGGSNQYTDIAIKINSKIN